MRWKRRQPGDVYGEVVHAYSQSSPLHRPTPGRCGDSWRPALSLVGHLLRDFELAAVAQVSVMPVARKVWQQTGPHGGVLLLGLASPMWPAGQEYAAALHA
jgi:hypothetical protein